MNRYLVLSLIVLISCEVSEQVIASFETPQRARVYVKIVENGNTIPENQEPGKNLAEYSLKSKGGKVYIDLKAFKLIPGLFNQNFETRTHQEVYKIILH